MTANTESKIQGDDVDFGEVVRVSSSHEAPSILLVCEHASNRIPAGLRNLGLSDDAIQSHVAWDIGALGVARALEKRLPAELVSGNVSRLVYDCNRPPEAASAVPDRSETYQIPGNTNLSDQDRLLRVDHVYTPFHDALNKTIERRRSTLQLMVTVHTFTPVFHGLPRSVELGILHGKDSRFAMAMMGHRPTDRQFDTRLNEPYAASDGVAFTLDAHGARTGLLNVMLEIRNDLVETPGDQDRMGEYLATWITATLETFGGSV